VNCNRPFKNFLVVSRSASGYVKTALVQTCVTQLKWGFEEGRVAAVRAGIRETLGALRTAKRPLLVRVDETYLMVRGRWTYLYRAVDRDGETVDFRLSPTRDVAAAKAFFRQSLRTQGRPPVTITLDGYAASHRAVREMPKENEAWKWTRLRSSKYLNNLIEQDHRGVKFRTGPMPGFKNFDNASTTIAGIELMRRIYKKQFSVGRLRLKDKASPEIWGAVTAA
jgi:transposase-like protein